MVAAPVWPRIGISAGKENAVTFAPTPLEWKGLESTNQLCIYALYTPADTLSHARKWCMTRITPTLLATWHSSRGAFNSGLLPLHVVLALYLRSCGSCSSLSSESMNRCTHWSLDV